MKRLMTVLILGLLLAACSGGDSVEVLEGGEQGGQTAQSPEEVEAARAAIAEDEGAIGVTLDVAQDRQVIRQAQLQLEANDTREAFEHIVALVEAAGGFVADANVYPVEADGDQPEVTMTLRIPAGELTETMESIKGSVAKVVSESQNAQDVTEQYVDLEAQLTNLQAMEVELRALLTEVRQQPDADPDKLLRVFNEISVVRGQIEQIQGQLNYLDDVVAMASLQVGITPTPAAVPIVEDTWEPVEAARDALRSLVSGLQGIADWGINFALYTLPMLILLLGPPLLVGFFVYRRWRRRRPPMTTTPVPSES